MTRKKTKTFNFGKIDYNETGRKINKVTVDITLYEKIINDITVPVFSACAYVYNSRGTDIIAGGQCLYSIKSYIKSPTYTKIYDMWATHHLNDMHPGTKEQTNFLINKHINDSSLDWEYDTSVRLLKEAGIYEVNVSDEEKKYIAGLKENTYRYGCGWVYYPIPEEDMSIINSLFDENEVAE